MKYKVGDRVVFLCDGNKHTGVVINFVTNIAYLGFPDAIATNYAIGEIAPPLPNKCNVVTHGGNILGLEEDMPIGRKTGTCKDCNSTLYGDDYGAYGHKCKAVVTTQETVDLLESYERMLKEELYEDHNTSAGRPALYNTIKELLADRDNIDLKSKVINALFRYIDNHLEGEYE